MMEKLGAPQTHLGLKSMIKEVDEDFDGKLSFREVPASCRRGAPGGGVTLKGPSDLQSPGVQMVLASLESCLDI